MNQSILAHAGAALSETVPPWKDDYLRNGAIPIYGSTAPAVHVWEGLHTASRESGVPLTAQFSKSSTAPSSAGDGRTIDVSFLQLCSEAYNISPDPADYVFPDVVIVEADVPNRNFDCFTYDDLLSWHPMIAMARYKTFLHRPTFTNHDNQVHSRAKGAIFDCSLEKIAGAYVVRVLLGFDRTKDPDLVRDITAGRLAGYSMGAIARYLKCSVCGKLTDAKLGCGHIIPKRTLGTLFDGKLAYNICGDFHYIETSSVSDPAMHRAWHTAVS